MNKTKKAIAFIFSKWRKSVGAGAKKVQWLDLCFLERERKRESFFSLDFLAFGPYFHFGLRSKAVLRPRATRGH